jgi:hypothetical protein
MPRDSPHVRRGEERTNQRLQDFYHVEYQSTEGRPHRGMFLMRRASGSKSPVSHGDQDIAAAVKQKRAKNVNNSVMTPETFVDFFNTASSASANANNHTTMNHGGLRQGWYKQAEKTQDNP